MSRAKSRASDPERLTALFPRPESYLTVCELANGDLIGCPDKPLTEQEAWGILNAYEVLRRLVFN